MQDKKVKGWGLADHGKERGRISLGWGAVESRKGEMTLFFLLLEKY